MNKNPDYDRQLAEFDRVIQEHFGTKDLSDLDIRMRPRTPGIEGHDGRLPSWALGVGFVLTTLETLVSKRLLGSFFNRLEGIIDRLPIGFTRHTVEKGKETYTDFHIGKNHKPTIPKKDKKEIEESSRALFSIMTAMKECGGMPHVLLYDASIARLIPAEILIDLQGKGDPTKDSMAAKTVTKILNNDQLPILPQAVQDLRSHAFNRDFEWNDVMAIVNEDAVLTGNILKFANTASRRGFNTITNARSACQRIGVRQVAGLAFGLALRPQSSVAAATFDADYYWAASAARAAAAWRIAKSIPGIEPQDAYTAGLLCKIGCLATATVFPQKYDAIQLSQGEDAGLNFCDIEQRLLGIDHAGISAAIIEKWNMPTWFCGAVRQHLNPYYTGNDKDSKLLAYIIAAACHVSSIFMGPKEDVLRHNVFSVINYGDYFGMDKKSLAPIFNESVEEWQETCSIYDASHKSVVSWGELMENVG